MEYISDIITKDMIQPHRFNLIYAGCGTGKTYWVTHQILDMWKDEVKPGDILYITSRRLAAEQAMLGFIDDNGTVRKPVCNDEEETDYEQVEALDEYIPEAYEPTLNNRVAILNDLSQDKIHVITASVFGQMISGGQAEFDKRLFEQKIIVVDEFHSLLSDSYCRTNTAVMGYLKYMSTMTEAKVIVMTATPGILAYYGYKMHLLNKKPLIRYKAKHLICTDVSKSYESVIDLVNNRFKGRTLIMCPEVNDCKYLQKAIPNSFVLVGKGHSYANLVKTKDAMNEVRRYIAENGNLPDTMPDGKPLDVLISTATMREGITLYEQSNIRNIVCCIPDEVSVIQFMGRVRGDVDNLVVANNNSIINNNVIKYLAMSRDKFKKLLAGNGDKWIRSIRHILADDVGAPEIISSNKPSPRKAKTPGQFYKVVDAWFIGIDITITNKAGEELVSLAKRCGIISQDASRKALGATCQQLRKHGYEVARRDTTHCVGKKRVHSVSYTISKCTSTAKDSDSINCNEASEVSVWDA